MMKRALSIALAAGSLAVAAGATMAVAPAQAETVGVYHGKVTATSGLSVRAIPSNSGDPVGALRAGQRFDIRCKVHGRSIGGNNLWYLVDGTKTHWVSARYVANVGYAPDYCGTAVYATGHTTAYLTERVAPSTDDPKRGVLARGATVRAVCQTSGPSIGGNTHWYNLTDGRWVSARYVSGLDRTPFNCGV